MKISQIYEKNINKFSKIKYFRKIQKYTLRIMSKIYNIN